MNLRTVASALVCAAAFSQQPPTAVIGFLEDHSTSQGAGESELRVAFLRRRADWVPAAADPSDQTGLKLSITQDLQTSQTWRITDSGNVLGTASTEGWSSDESYSSLGLLRVKTTVPFLGKRSAIYGGWTGGTPYAPMLALLGSDTVSAVRWHRSPVHTSDLRTVWQSFQKAVPKVPRCDGKGAWIQPEPDTTAKDVEVTAAFVGPHGNRLICARLREDRLGPCDGVPDRSVSGFWFLVLPKGKVQILAMPEGDDALDLTPLDFAEVDGEAIAVFLGSGYDRDGYVLYYDGFRK